MMIPPPSAGDPYAAAAALDRRLRSPDADAPSSDDTATPDAGPDVVVTLGQAASPASTYDASGRMPRAPTLDDMGANAPDSLAHARESISDDDATPQASSANVDEDAAVPA